MSSEELEKICGGTLDEKLSKFNLKQSTKFGPRLAYGLVNPRDELNKALENRKKENNEDTSLTQIVESEKSE